MVILCGSDHLAASFCSSLKVLSRSLRRICTKDPTGNETCPGYLASTRLLKAAFRLNALLTVSLYPSSNCCSEYASCVSMSSVLRTDVVFLTGVVGVPTVIPNRSSFSENFRLGSSLLLSVRIASSKWRGQVLGSSSQLASSWSSSPNSGAQIHLRMCNSNLFIPSTSLFTQGK